MAISFSDLHTEAGLKALDEFLSGKTYISGEEISKDDIKVFAAVSKNPGEGLSNVCRWYESVSSVLAARFPGKAVGVTFPGQAASSAQEPPVEAVKKAAGDDDDDLDLFGEETEDEKKAAEEREAAVKASSKKKESGKSSVLLDVKPWDDETDMKKLEEAVRSIKMEGLLWGASKLAPVGYGIKKLQIMLTIVDDLVSVDNLIEDYLTSYSNLQQAATFELEFLYILLCFRHVLCLFSLRLGSSAHCPLSSFSQPLIYSILLLVISISCSPPSRDQCNQQTT
ncbi:hypothetical protein J5N97_009135 [Dioscorea zingiberensis]|uniref:Translation elongation factor EF1B beta/delta subunit guanine nucleotide exchange domain-containing protein n=1 Tax=Dioscorea zingiberensis TaxID=325984 RepID=A0A9D5HL58_9LILI|nr:hypothetical protein J5N97_009135 [Dioscorea zingiberensis]